LFSEHIREVSEIVTDHGEKLQVAVREGEVFINDAKIVRSDVITKTGVVHVLDTLVTFSFISVLATYFHRVFFRILDKF
jgi:uncharacterized surface protein with fasciclin (FAS1) repeats